MTDLPGVIRSQLTQDPQLPRSNPTVSSWQIPQNPHVGAIKSSQLPRKVDYAVIGSGVAACGVVRGLLSNLSSGSKTVTVFEARGLCSGATGRNGGQLTRLPPTRHTYILENFGAEQANKVLRLTVKGLEEMHQLAASQGKDFQEYCRIRRLEKFFAYYDEESWNETVEAVKLLEQEIPEERGVYQLVTKEETSSKYKLNGAFGGLRLPAGVCSPYNLVTGTFKFLLDKYQDRLTIETECPVTAVSYLENEDAEYPYLIDTPRGSVRAATVIHCSNGFTGHLVPGLRGKMYPRRGTMSVQSPGKKFPNMSMKQSWSLYFTPDHDTKSQEIETGRYYCFQHHETGELWIGGDKDSIDGFITSDDSTVDRCAEKNIRTMLPKLFSKEWVGDDAAVQRVWSGIMCYTGDQLPLVGRLPASATGRQGKGEWIAGGWNTYGMTNGLLCGDALSKLILGEDINEWFPECYSVTDERLKGKKFTEDAVVRDYFERIGAKEIAKSML
ncbi:FAD dependent oxidoreductase-domain-containing protein [Hypoxylon rubiginosum]|uniref:FAD dependent oxidoreductase-domain-containing protein n=1 Tax=Hypoxylon rubiginosum TaxID=110542 RepID=A0ACC0CLJ5_9PEZI|nr:FAD dependent oxidoreductase-domain-containing protein [Hypoxylon rubiginosum]